MAKTKNVPGAAHQRLQAAKWKKLFYRLSMVGLPVLMLPVIYFGCAISISGGSGFSTLDPPLFLALRYFAENLLAGLCAWGFSVLAEKLRDRDRDNARYALFANVLMGAGLLLLLAGYAAAEFTLSASFFIALAAHIFTYILVWRKAGKNYALIIDKKIIVAYAIIAIIAVIAFWGMKVSYSRMTLCWGIFYLAVCYALAQNQSNIDFMMERRKHKLEHLPDAVRGRSLKLTLAVIAAAFVCVLLAPQIGWLFGRALGAVRYILVAVLRFIFGLFPDSEPSETTEETISGDTGGMGGLVGDDEGSPLWDYIMWPLIILVICWLLYTYRDSIMRWWITLWRTLRAKIKGALFSTTRRAGYDADGEGDYEDEVVELSAMEVREETRRDTFRLRQWKKAVRLWQAETDSPEKYRAGYKLALEWLAWKKVPLSPSDTPLAVLEKARRALPESEWAPVTDWYNLIRYGEPTPFPAESIPTLEKALVGMGK